MSKRELILKGYVQYDEDNYIWLSATKERYNGSKIIELNEEIFGKMNGIKVLPSERVQKESENNLNYDGDDGFGYNDGRLENVKCSYYYGPEEISLEEIQKRNLAKILGGAIDTYGYDYGYSEFSIMGCEYDHFTIGGHDLTEELKSHISEYIVILIEYDSDLEE